MTDKQANDREPEKIADRVAERGFESGWSRSEWASAIKTELDRYRDEILEIRGCDKCDLCEDHHA